MKLIFNARSQSMAQNLSTELQQSQSFQATTHRTPIQFNHQQISSPKSQK